MKSVRRTMVPIAKRLGGKVLESNGQLLNFAEIPLDADLSDITIEELLEVTGSHVMDCGAFNAVCEEAGIYQLWTEEYVTHLGGYLLERSFEFDGETCVLDVGAGDGLLVKFLTEFLELEKKRLSKIPGKSRIQEIPTVIATDDGSWGIFAKAQVEKLNMRDALTKYKTTNSDSDRKRQLIILCSWMPMGEDWSVFFRQHEVDEYILIGEADDGSCGHNWDTWGNPSFLPAEGSNSSLKVSGDPQGPEDKQPLYLADGYERWDMEALAQYQFSRFDCAVSRSSKTVSFRRRHR